MNKTPRECDFLGVFLCLVVYLTASFRALPALKPTVWLAGIWIAAPVWGFLPVRALRLRTEKVPKPIRLTSSLRAMALVISSVIAVITSLAFSLDRLALAAIAAASSGLRIGTLLLRRQYCCFWAAGVAKPMQAWLLTCVRPLLREAVQSR